MSETALCMRSAAGGWPTVGWRGPTAQSVTWPTQPYRYEYMRVDPRPGIRVKRQRAAGGRGRATWCRSYAVRAASAAQCGDHACEAGLPPRRSAAVFLSGGEGHETIGMIGVFIHVVAVVPCCAFARPRRRHVRARAHARTHTLSLAPLQPWQCPRAPTPRRASARRCNVLGLSAVTERRGR